MAERGQGPTSRRDLARSLDDRANRLAGLGRWEEALAANGEALGIYRELAAARPDAIRPDLARSLTNQSTWLVQLGRNEEAFGITKESIGIYSELAAIQPETFRPHLAASLEAQAVHMVNLGRHDVALAYAKAAVNAYQELAATRPDAFESDLAHSLAMCGSLLYELHRIEDAVPPLAWAFRIAATRGDEFYAMRALGILRDAYRRYPARVAGAWKRATETDPPDWLTD